MRHQLLFQRTIPDFEPSAESYAIAVATLDLGRDMLASAGITDAASLDPWTALLTGMVDRQLANDPRARRSTRLLADAVDMFLARHRRGRRRKVATPTSVRPPRAIPTSGFQGAVGSHAPLGTRKPALADRL